MKTRLFYKLCCLCLIVNPVVTWAVYGPDVLETEEEFFVYGDFNGDEIRDFIVIDRASGGMRQVEGTSGGALLMEETLACGITDVTGVTVGHLTLSDRDTIAVTSPLANRVRVCGPWGRKFDVWPSGISSRYVTAVDLPGGGDGKHDLVSTTELNQNSPLGSYRRSFMLNQLPTFSLLLVNYSLEAPQHPLAVDFGVGGASYYSELCNDGGTLAFNVYKTTATSALGVPLLASCNGILPGSRVLYGNLVTSSETNEFLFHVPGTATLQLSSSTVSAVNGATTIAAPVLRSLDTAAETLQLVEAGGGLWLVAVGRGGALLHVYSFGTSDVPELKQTIAAPQGKNWSAVMPAAGGKWFAASQVGNGPSVSFRRFDFDPFSRIPFQAAGDYDLENLYAEELGSDVLLFTGEPFLDPEPVLRGRYRVGGWTSNLNDNPAFGSDIYVDFETWRGSDQGLGSVSTRYFGIRPDSVTHGLSNQISASQSFYSLDSPIGDVPDLLTFSPVGGDQIAGVEVTLSCDDETSSIYFSYAADATAHWYAYSGPIGPISSDTTVYAFAENNGVKTPIQSETYTFPEYAGDIDSDGDGVPDFVEQAEGLHPVASGTDGDGDDVSDLLEILAGTDPTDDGDFPDAGVLLPYTRHFDFTAEPLSHSGVTHDEKLSLAASWSPPFVRGEVGTLISVNRPDGTEAYSGVARAWVIGNPVQWVANDEVIDNPPLFWIAGTQNRFKIEVPLYEPDNLRGRGVFRLMDYDAVDLEPFPEPELSGTSEQQVNDWTHAMRNHFLAGSEVSVGGRVSFYETADLLLAEYALGLIFYQRSLILSPKITLTPFRGDVERIRGGRCAIRESWIRELADVNSNDNGYDWQELLAYIRADNLPNESGGVGPARTHFDAVVREFYRIGYYAYDDSFQPLTLPPFDAIRDFIETRTIPPEYATDFALSDKVVVGANNYLTALANLLPERHYTDPSLILTAEPGFHRGSWMVLNDSSSGIEYWLADQKGQPMAMPLGFRILPDCQFEASGYLTTRAEGGMQLIVDEISLLEIPTPEIVDSDANVLMDSWESFYFGVLGNSAFADPDGDGYQNLQEMLECSDPGYVLQVPSASKIDLTLRSPEIARVGKGGISLSLHWPTLYQDRVRFSLKGSSDLLHYNLLNPDVPAVGVDLYEAQVDLGEVAPHFFKLDLGLRGTGQ